MRTIFYLIVLMHVCILTFAQKKPLDFEAAKNWPIIEGARISGDGKYVFYTLYQRGSGRLVIQSTDHSWKMELNNVSASNFTDNSQNLIFSNANDSIGILNMYSKKLTYIVKATSLASPKINDNTWLAYRPTEFPGRLTLRNIVTGREEQFDNVKDCQFNDNGSALVLSIYDPTSKDGTTQLNWINLVNLKATLIHKDAEISDLTLDKFGLQCAFVVFSKKNGQTERELWHYKIGMQSAELLVDQSTPGMEGMALSEGRFEFSSKGDKFFFNIENLTSVRVSTNVNQALHILNYKDDSLTLVKGTRSLLSVVHLKTPRHVIQLMKLKYKDKFGVLNEMGNADYCLISSNSIGRVNEYGWRTSARTELSLVSTMDGSRISLINKQTPLFDYCEFSGSGKYVIWYDKGQKQWYTYNLVSKISTSISNGIINPLDEEDDHPDLSMPCGIAGWLENDLGVFIYDRYDIWRVDPDGAKAPINITHSYGKKNSTKLRCLTFNEGISAPFKINDDLLLCAFNQVTKENGFFKLMLKNNNNLQKLLLESKLYYMPGVGSNIRGDREPLLPIKAKYVNKYILSRTSNLEYPNLFTTTDFLNFKELSYLIPQKEYNWYYSELVHWKLFDGKTGEGLLYKPEDFDPGKKYPIIFYIYEKNSDILNSYLYPDLSQGELNIAWFVSNGYLVFVPDIHYQVGHPGESAYNSAGSAIEYFETVPWADTKHIGLQGHSFGGFETNYLVTRTSKFAAAISCSGFSDIVSKYNSMLFTERMQWFYEKRQGRIGATLWEKPNLYIENSPVFKADQVKTPILLQHNKVDFMVEFSQAIEWYSALSRLQKKAWLLSYDGEGHTIDNEKNQLDFSIRMAQFFDHYLKGKPAPLWMTKGENSYDLDPDSKLNEIK